MVEYLYDCIRANAGENNVIVANITEDGIDIDTGISMFIANDDKEIIIDVVGEYMDGVWYFNIPATDLRGRYWYVIERNKNDVSFYEPIYFI